MSKQAFPEAYIGAGHRFTKLRGIEEWNIERASSINRREKELPDWLASDSAERPLNLVGRAACQLELSLLYAWEGRLEPARKLMANCAATTSEYFERWWPSKSPEDCCQFAVDGAMAAALVNQPNLAHKLFTYAAHFGARLITGEEDEPIPRYQSYYPMVQQRLVQAYSLIRLGQFSGFRASLFPVGFPEAKKVLPVWGSATADALLNTIETDAVVATAKRLYTAMWNFNKYQIPVLKTLSAHLQNPTEETKAAVQKALIKYYGMIRDLSDFPPIYLRVLDLQKAYPQIYHPVIPGVFV